MPNIRIQLFDMNNDELLDSKEFIVKSDKAMIKSRASKILAQYFPEFLRAKGRNSAFAGNEILPILEKNNTSWLAFRLNTGDKSHSGYQPPLKGRVAKLNQVDNPFNDLKRGNWIYAIISEV